MCSASWRDERPRYAAARRRKRNAPLGIASALSGATGSRWGEPGWIGRKGRAYRRREVGCAFYLIVFLEVFG